MFSFSGLYDPFSLDYAPWAFDMFGIPLHIMPKVVDDAGDHFGSIDANILGAEIAIKAVMADQSASVYGQCCFHPGQTKMSLGSGSFLDVNTGKDIHASMKGLVI
jgi:putative glycerol kinase 5